MLKFLHLLLIFSFVTGRYRYGEFVYKQLPREKKEWRKVEYTLYPREVRLFQDDNYCKSKARQNT